MAGGTKKEDTTKMGETVEQQQQQQASEGGDSGKLTIIRFKEDSSAEDRAMVEKSITDNGGTIEKRMDLIGAIGVKLGNAHSGDFTAFRSQHDAVDYVEEDKTYTTQ
ncbi:hypothetical protein IWW48_001127 [Coemansia sp. RSA 1200]|nr:hypothetical protein IWW48_001127 [Coemansia sp. RSA 1200]